MPDLITDRDFAALFTDFTRAALRLEVRGAYDVESERAALRRFLSGQRDDPDYQASRSGWLDEVGKATAGGKRFARVRVAEDPPTAYQRFGMRNARFNVEAGEDIRYMRRAQANALSIPAHDFWLFDDTRLALLYFTADDRLLGAQVVTHEAVVRQHAEWLTTGFDHARPYAEFVNDTLIYSAPVAPT